MLMDRASNLGEVRQRRRRRNGDPMRAYDALPAPLRRWMAEAALPWSPASCRRIWTRARQRGETVDTVLDRLTRAEAACLARETLPRGLSGHAHSQH
ncbi:hypothetical protein GGQ68_001302 [Sagittula marina]|uniref:Uncharacterized protein n=2 Tax=Roseobacteraceae TaxID=2854170 RepID=A0A7W6DRY1_9RHOB|nr:hypothetical protein [Sagittula marina]